MKKSFYIILTLTFLAGIMFAQNIGINDDGSSPNNSALLDVKSNTKGMLIPRMTQSQIEAINNPANGLQVHCTSDNKMYIYVASFSIWKAVAYEAGIITPGGGGTCGQPFTDVRDGKIYNTIYIGSQCWMAQNLNIGIRINGTSNQTNNGIIEKYCYEDLETNCDLFGGLYQWNEMMQYTTVAGTQGSCPAGWHCPTDAEWTTLTTFLGGEWIAGGKMKSTGTIQAATGLWNEPNTGATNSSGFSSIPGGNRDYTGTFSQKGNNAFFWTSSETTTLYAWYRAMNYVVDNVYRYAGSVKTYGHSNRCLRDL